MEISRKSSLMLAFLLAFFIISSDMIMNSEATRHAIGSCNRNPQVCNEICSKCFSCICEEHTCYCKSPPSNNTISFRI
ncbi:hypothetical protein PHAVU_005G159700 [Phaseolus vulgaris]|uniref:Uncharacterized protein n=1 Tax=Phaseolus vulgaris TaxID=3885 RepID=V7BX50_PHAVU|nr:hypothetical protein PHAVU_005G159700g [Phaseolus vulgaris]ESW22519.1 hypothetical protein PHAVU_005G159700g [Phaseolus vulgaris]